MYLGLNCAQRQFKALIIDSTSGKTIFSGAVDYDQDLPHRDTRDGITFDRNTAYSYTDPQLWIEALDLILERIVDEGIDVSKIKVISGCARPSVLFFNDQLPDAISHLNPNLTLIDQLRPCYTSRKACISLDSTASSYKKEIEAQFGTPETIQLITGTRHHTNTGCVQIKKFADLQPQSWDETNFIHTAGTYLSSVLTGKQAPLDHSDSAQLGLVDLKKRAWDSKLIAATSSQLEEKLPQLREGLTEIGCISDYFVHKYGFSPETRCTIWHSKTACDLVGIGMNREGITSIKLSDTYTCSTALKAFKIDPIGAASISIHPLGGYIGRVSLENGYRTFATVRRALGVAEDAQVEELLDIIPTTKNEPVLPFLFEEKSLAIPASDIIDTTLLSLANGQFLHLKLYSQWHGSPTSMLIISGKGMYIEGLRNVAANVFQSNAVCMDNKNTAATGACILAANMDGQPLLALRKTYCRPYFKTSYAPEPYMANIYNAHLLTYHKKLQAHLHEQTL